MPSRGTTPTQIRLTAADKAVFEAIRRIWGLDSLSETIRRSGQHTLAVLAVTPGAAPAKPRKKSAKGA